MKKLSVILFNLLYFDVENNSHSQELLYPGSMALLRRRIAAEVARRLRSPWTPHYCKVKDICWRGQPPQWQREVLISIYISCCLIGSWSHEQNISYQ